MSRQRYTPTTAAELHVSIGRLVVDGAPWNSSAGTHDFQSALQSTLAQRLLEPTTHASPAAGGEPFSITHAITDAVLMRVGQSLNGNKS